MANLPLVMSLADDLNRMTMAPLWHADPSMYYCRQPSWSVMPREHHGHMMRPKTGTNAGPLATVGKDGFQVCMDVAQFKPSELKVRVLDNHVTIEGKHEEREDDHGYISRHFVRRYTLPKGYDADHVMSTLSSDGVLTVNVPKPQIEDKTNGRIVQIQQVGPAHLNVKENPKEDHHDKTAHAANNSTK